jgi:hypothetical protein
MVAIWLIAGDRLEGGLLFFVKAMKRIQFSELKRRIYFIFFINDLKYEQMFMGLSMKFGEQLKNCHYEKY